MKKPKIGDRVKLLAGPEEYAGMGEGVVLELYDDIDVWWDTPYGESKVALMDSLADDPAFQNKTAEWFAMIENVDCPGEVMAIASFEVEVVE